MFAKQPIADVSDAFADAWVAARVHRQVAFRVDPHRTAGEVRRPNSDQFVVDDHHLRVDEDGHVLRAGRRRVEDAQAPVSVGVDQLPEDGVAKRAHRVPLEPAVAFLWRDDRTSGPSGSRNLAPSAGTELSSFVKYWLSM